MPPSTRIVMKHLILIIVFLSMSLILVKGQSYLSAVQYNGSWGYADQKGNMIITPNFAKAYPFDTKSGIARIKNYNDSPNVPQYGEIHGKGGEGGDFIFIKR